MQIYYLLISIEHSIPDHVNFLIANNNHKRFVKNQIPSRITKNLEYLELYY